MPRFILNDEKTRNSYGFKINTAGIYLGRFETNPVMLDGHINANSHVIGSWKDIKKENGQLTAETVFDMEDPKAAEIAGKVDRNVIRSCSMGISFKKSDLKMIDGELTLTACELHEASIVAIPSNSSALKLTMDGEELSDTDVKELCLSLLTPNPSPKERGIPETFKTKNMTIKLSQLAFLALGLAATTVEAPAEQIESLILALSKEKEETQKKLDLSNEQLNAYIQKEKDAKAKAVTEMVDAALAAGKITADKKQSFIELATANFELAKTTLDAIPAKQNFSAGINTPVNVSGVATMEDFQKLSTEQQLAFKEQNPDAYQTILNSI